jgi:AraC-like DNA-binding protein
LILIEPDDGAAMIRFGPWSTILGLGALFGVTIALALFTTRINRAANRLLAILLVTISLQMTPYVIGYAGFYDAWPGLSFLPIQCSLAIGPLLYLHIVRLSAERLPDRWWRHLIPACIQLLYYAIVFPFPLAMKDGWNDRIHEAWIDPVETVATFISMAVYLRLAWRQHADYQNWLKDHISNVSDFRLVWQRNVILAMALTLLAWTLTSVATTFAHLDYLDRFPFYLGLAGLVFYLGLEGWRHAAQRYPLPASKEDSTDASRSIPDAATGTADKRDWTQQGTVWLEMTAEAGWWRDPQLSLEQLARHLGTNTAYLSRAFNAGLGRNFSEVIASLRVQDVQDVLASEDPRDLLDIALAAGFSSKSSFNRVFKSQTGETPSQYRARIEQGRASS